MLKNKKIVVVMPAYNAALTLKKTYSEIPMEIVDEVILVDDKSSDETVETAKAIGIKHVISHERNKGYGGNQKTCYQKALELGADVVIMLHPDYQYTPKLIESIAPELVDEICGRESDEGKTRRYVAGRSNRVSLNGLVREGFGEIVIGEDTPVYRDVTIVGTPGVQTGISISVADGFKGEITLENAALSGRGDGGPAIDIGEDTTLNFVVCDKDVVVNPKRMLCGIDSYPVCISKKSVV